MGVDLAGAILDCVPIDQSGEASVIDDAAKALVVGQRVANQITGNELIVELAQCQDEAVHQIFVDDLVGLLDHPKSGGVERPIDEFLLHRKSPMVSPNALATRTTRF